MWTFGGLLIVAFVVWRGFRRLTNVVTAMGIVFERAVNRGAIRQGDPPITTHQDEMDFQERFRP